jgi:predicted ATPase
MASRRARALRFGRVTAAAEDVLAKLNRGTAEAPVALGGYDVIGRLGRGGMGTVYEAIDRERGTVVALKTLLGAGAAAGMKLKREFRVVADLAHPNLAPVYELACEDGLWFFTMEKVEGTSLSSWARGSRDDEPSTTALPVSRTLTADFSPTSGEDTVEDFSLPPLVPRPDASAPTRDLAEIREALVDLASGVGALHDAGLRHGDIKPDNVLVREDGRVVVVDFGLARPVGEGIGRVGAGTPAYMAPEQLAGEYVGPESDWYAVGTTLFRLLTGALPFGGDSMLDLFFKKVHHMPAAPHELVPAIPLDLSELCMALLRPDRRQRAGKEAVLRITGSEDAPVPSQRYRRSVFVGRERELCALEQAYGTARAGALTLVHTHGPSGIGKTALLDSFLRGVQDVDSAVVLRGRCYERESVPYKGFDRIVDELAERMRTMSVEAVEQTLPEWCGELTRAFPALLSVPEIAARVEGVPVVEEAKELRRRAWIAFGELLGALRLETPVVIAIDDLQWADPDSANLLAELLRGTTAMMVIIGFRADEAKASPALPGYFEGTERLASRGMLVDLPLGPLREEEALQLARSSLTAVGVAVSPERVKLLAGEAHGVPFFIEELAHFMSTKGADALDTGITLREAILARVQALPDDQRALIETVAVANKPLPQSLVFIAAGLEAGALSCLLALRRASLVSWLGAGADDAVSTYHDRIRQTVAASLSDENKLSRHLALGRALVARGQSGPGAWVFDAVHHLGAAAPMIDDRAERLAAARLHLQAAERARKAAAFPLAFRCFEGGIALLEADAWDSDYELALRLSAGAAECAYLAAEWDALDARIADVKRHGRTVMDQLVAWEAQIDAHVGRHQYQLAVDAALEVLALLDVVLPADPAEAEVGAAVTRTLERLTEVGPDGLMAMPDLEDARIAAATRIQVRVSPAAYFGRPMLLPIIACNLVTTSIDRGLSTATPYALALFGIVLNTLELFTVSHTWGKLALTLLDRWPDRRLEAATRHVLHNLVCCWMVPLSSVLEPLRAVFDIGVRTGDFEYASYAAHGYVHNAMYAGRPLQPLIEEGLELGEQMRALGEVNALHVHAPFEKLLLGLTGGKDKPWTLDDHDFDEAELLAAFESEGSRSGIFVQRVVMGLARYHFGRFGEARACFGVAAEYFDAAPSVWHMPILHQFRALSASALYDGADEATQVELRAEIAASLAVLQRLAAVNPVNFAHRVSLIEAELLRIDGANAGAIETLERAILEARTASWINDIALANELAAGCATEPDEAKRYLRAARAGYSAWGATAKAARLAERIEAS